jgi:hypothetical protein
MMKQSHALYFKFLVHYFLCGENKLRDHKLINEGCGEPKNPCVFFHEALIQPLFQLNMRLQCLVH